MADLKKHKHIFFDLDDTLWDFQRNSRTVLEDLFIKYGLEQKLNTSSDGFIMAYQSVNRTMWRKYESNQLDKEYLRNNRIYETFRTFGYDNYEENLLVTGEYLERAPKGNCLKDGCIETLEYLRLHYDLHIITNGFRETQSLKIDGCGLRGYFSNIIISEEHGCSKPSETIFRLAEQFAKAECNQCVMIGDSYESDILGARSAGWDAIYFNNNPSEEFHGKRISRLEELREIF